MDDVKLNKLTQLKHKEIKEYREKILKEQKGICPLTWTKIPEGKAALDHQHRLKSEELGKNGAGLIRGVLHLQANALEGKILYWYKRLGLTKMIDLPTFLRNLADYLEKKPYPIIHPTEAKLKKLSKVCYNKLDKICKEKISFPKSGKLTKKLKKLFKKYGVEITYRK